MVARARHTGGGSPEGEFWQLVSDFGQMLRGLRQSSGNPSIRVMADRMSLSPAGLSDVLFGRRVPSWKVTERLLRELDASPFQAEQIRRAWENVDSARKLRRTGPAGPADRAGQAIPSGTVVINGDGSTVYVSNAAGSGSGPPPGEPPALIPDLDGHALKPDPLQATTFDELTEFMREFRAWAGHPSSRTLASRSGGEFSHATIIKLLSSQPGWKPPLKLGYVRGFIHACGGDDEDLSRWITAWRRIDQGKAAPHARHARVIVIKPPAEPAS